MVKTIKSILDVELFGDNIALSPIEEEFADGIVRGVASDGKADMGVVVAVSKKAKTQDGKTFKIGDIILFNRYAPDKITINGKEFLILHAEDAKGRRAK